MLRLKLLNSVMFTAREISSKIYSSTIMTFVRCCPIIKLVTDWPNVVSKCDQHWMIKQGRHLPKMNGNFAFNNCTRQLKEASMNCSSNQNITPEIQFLRYNFSCRACSVSEKSQQLDLYWLEIWWRWSRTHLMSTILGSVCQ